MFNSGIRGRRAQDGVGTISSAQNFNQQQFSVPYISSFAVTDGSYQPIDDQALDPAGGQIIVLYGSGFRAGVTVQVGAQTVSVVTLLDSNRITFTSPALSAGSYTVYARNSNGGTAALVPGLIYSALPSWTTDAGNIGVYYETSAVSSVVEATEGADTITYTLASGELPPGSTLNANGTITGTTESTANATTYTFTIRATDEELQDSTRQFTITVNPDVVSWISPADGTEITATANTAISNVTLSATSAAGFDVAYTANALPTGITLTGNVIAGTPTTEQTVSTLLTATANTSGRLATRTISWTVQVSDPFFKNTVLLLNGDTGDQVFTKDASDNNFQLTVVGDTRPNRMSPYWPGGWSGYFDGTGDYLTAPNNSALLFQSTNNWTLEFWFNTSAQSGAIVDTYYVNSSPYSGLAVNLVNGTINTYEGGGNRATSQTYNNNRWHHFAWVNNSGISKIYINGENVAVGGVTSWSTSSNVYRSTAPLWIGGQNWQTNFYTGYLSNFRIVQGTAVYTENFTPSTTPLEPIAGTSLLTLRDPQFVDDGPYRFTITRNGDTKITTASPFNTQPYTLTSDSSGVFFNGNGNNLSLIPGTFGANDFTIEFWVYCLVSTEQTFWNNWRWYNGLTPGSIAILYNNGTVNGVVYTGGGQLYSGAPGVTVSSAAVTLQNTWTHIALSRQGGNIYLGVNGVVTSAQLSSNTGLNLESRTTYNIGVWNENSGGPAWNTNGVISNFRIVKGSALYTSNYSVPTEPLTAVSGTSLLTCLNTQLIDYSSDARSITVTGSVMTNFNPFGETVTTINNYSYDSSLYSASGYFDGTGDYLTIPGNAAFNLSSGAWTLECWVYIATLKNSQVISQGAAVWRIAFFSDGSAQFLFNTSSTMPLASAGELVAGQWYHFAVCNANTGQNNQVKTFLNGVQKSSGLYNPPNDSSTTIYIGRNIDASGSWDINSYISNLRLVKGTALYTGPFVPPTAPLSAISGTSLLTLQRDLDADNSAFVDVSPNNLLITRTGNATQGSASPYAPTGWSGYFPATGSYFTGSNAAFNISSGTKQWSMECWVYPITTGHFFAIGSGSPYGNSFAFSWSSSTNKFSFGQGNGSNSSPVVITSSGTFTANQWYHVAVTKDSSGVIRMFVNGTQQGTQTYTGSVAGGTTFVINGLYDNNGLGNNGGSSYISNLRFVTNTAIYTSNFTPSTAPLTPITGTILLTCQSPSLVDAGPNRVAITRAGSAVIAPFSPFVPQTVTPNSYSIYFDGTGDYITTPASSTTALVGGALNATRTFTIEAWVYINQYTNGSGTIIGDMNPTATTNYWSWGCNSTGKLNLYWYDGSGRNAVGNTTVQLGTWTHIAVSINAGAIKLFVDGQLQTITGTSTLTSATGSLGYLTLGQWSNGGSTAGFFGLISNLRIVNGTALYSENFTPSTTPLTAVSGTSLLIAQTTDIRDSSSNNYTLSVTGNTQPTTLNPFGSTATIDSTGYNANSGAGSAYFDGSGDYLTVANDPSLNLSSGDWTIEFWMYWQGLTSGSSGELVFSKDHQPSVAYPQYELIINTSSQLVLYLGNGTSASVAATAYTGSTVQVGAWTHVALVKTGTTIKMFQNGVQTVSTTQGQAMVNGPRPLVIGYATGQSSANAYFKGYISDFRIVKGTAIYTASFVPPAAPSDPDISNTSLLLPMTNGGIIDVTQRNNLETVGNTRIDSAIKKYGTGSMYFDGTGDYLVVNSPDPSLLAFGTGDFTIEFWVNPASSSATYNFVDFRPSDGGAYITIYQTSSTVRVYINGALRITGNALTANTWSHIAVTRSGTSTKLFINGTQSGSTYTDTTNYLNATNRPLIGASFAGGDALSGYIDDLRITKGVARYTSNFTPPTKLLTT